TAPTTGNPEAVATGIEFSIPVSEIGNPAGPIKLFAFINGTGHDYASNQFSGEGILDANLGENGFGGSLEGDGLPGVIMTDFPGDQFVTIPNPAVAAAAAIPEPMSAALVGLALMAGVGALRRR
ncbi:MAG TPA: PEP-CTERM sorting domain-containing protein, partial [Lacipirellula sp.]